MCRPLMSRQILTHPMAFHRIDVSWTDAFHKGIGVGRVAEVYSCLAHTVPITLAVSFARTK